MLLVNTRNSGGIVFDNLKCCGFIRNNHRAFSYAWGDDDFLYSATESGIEKLTKNRAHFDSFPHLLNYPHQSIMIGSRIYVCDSGAADGEIKILDLKTREWKSHLLGGSFWINSVNYIDGKLYFIAHNRGSSFLIETDLDFQKKKITNDIGFASHNVWKMDGKLWTCSSLEGKLRAIDGSQEIIVGGFTRGIAIDDKYLYVGVSRIRSTASLTIDIESVATIERNPGVAVLTKDSFEEIAFLDIDDNIYDLNILQEKDRTRDYPDLYLSFDVNNSAVLLTGLPSAGKTTIGKSVVDVLRSTGHQAVLLDGDQFRGIFPTGFSEDDRKAHIIRIGKIASVLQNNGAIPVIALIAPYESVRQELKTILKDLKIIHVATSLDECRRRDVKGLYAKQAAGEISGLTGADAPYEVPLNPALTVDTTAEDSYQIAHRIINSLRVIE